MSDTSSKSPLVKRLLRRGRAAASRAVRDRLRDLRADPNPVITFAAGSRTEARQGPIPRGTSVLRAAVQLGVDLDHFCGGHCSCGTCRVQILEGAENLSRIDLNEELVVGGAAQKRGDRLACQARVLGPVTVQVPEFYGGVSS